MEQDPLKRWRDADLDLAGLVASAAELLAQCPRPPDERVSSLPDERTIRYYQTSGLVEKPSRYEGRTARYGFRHLLQVCCIKLLQYQGLGLAAIQQALAGATDVTLESALRERLGMGRAPPPAPRSLLSVELRPGIYLLLDPELHKNPSSIIQTLSTALEGMHP